MSQGGIPGLEDLSIVQPSLSPSPGSYDRDLSVSLAESTPGVQYYYTLDGSEPNESSPRYGGPILVAGNGSRVTIKALGIKDSKKSSTTTAVYEVNWGKVSTPQFFPSAGNYNLGPAFYFSLSTQTEGAEIWYTLDNSIPEKNGLRSFKKGVGNEFLSRSATVKAIAFKDGMLPSSVSMIHYARPPLMMAPNATSISCTLAVPELRFSAELSYPSDGSIGSSGLFGYELFSTRYDPGSTLDLNSQLMAGLTKGPDPITGEIPFLASLGVAPAQVIEDFGVNQTYYYNPSYIVGKATKCPPGPTTKAAIENKIALDTDLYRDLCGNSGGTLRTAGAWKLTQEGFCTMDLLYKCCK